MWWCLALLSWLAVCAQAFAPAPIQLGGLHSKRFVMVPKDSTSGVLVPAQRLMLWDWPNKNSPHEIPYFTANSDKTISWDAGDSTWCVEADGNAVRINHCTGEPTQLWKFMPQGHGRTLQIQLQDTDKCIHIDDKSGLNGALVELRNCDHIATESWTFGEQSAHPSQGCLPMLSLVMLSLGLSAIVRRRQGSARSASWTIDQGGVCINLSSSANRGSSPSVPAVMTINPAQFQGNERDSAMRRGSQGKFELEQIDASGVNVPSFGTDLAQQARSMPSAMAASEVAETGFSIPFGAPKPTGTLIGAITLVAGTTVGAGILALPATTFKAGFPPSLVTLFLCWMYMSASGLLIAEVNVNTLCSLEKDAVSLDSMARETLGEFGARVTGAAYIFIHYALLIAYMLQGGSLLLEYLSPLLGTGNPLPTVYGPLLFASIVGGAIFIGSERQVETANSILFGGVLVSFFALVALGIPQVDAALLTRANVGAVVPAVPVCVLSLVYHNVVPTICYQLGCDLNKISTAIVVGSGIPTVMFILWNLVILGSVPPEAAVAAATAADGVNTLFDPLEGLRASGDSFGFVVRGFSLLAIITSFIGFNLGLVDYFADALAGPLAIEPQPPSMNVDADDSATDATESITAPRYTLVQRSVLFAATLVPPLAVALYDPSLFFAALDNAGTFGILVLFGIIPAAMTWRQRYGNEDDPYADIGSDLAVPAVLPGGRLTLALIGGLAVSVIALETYERLAGALSP